MKLLKLIKTFFRLNFHFKVLIIEAIFLTAFYRFLILNFEFKNYSYKLGEKGVELSLDGTKEGYILSRKISIVINRISQMTPWESKCLVKAMTAQKMMKKRGYNTTLYLGVGKDRGIFNAHAWLRYGKFYITGGDGSLHKKVAQFSLK